MGGRAPAGAHARAETGVRRVHVESPFAPQTPLPEGGCKGSPYVQVKGYGGYAWDCGCAHCTAADRRKWEATRNARYLAACLRDCVRRGETPYASHGLLTLPGVLRDDVPEERELGIRAGFAMREAMHATAFYTDLGWSRGMRAGEEHAKTLLRQAVLPDDLACHKIEYRTLGPDWDK